MIVRMTFVTGIVKLNLLHDCLGVGVSCLACGLEPPTPHPPPPGTVVKVTCGLAALRSCSDFEGQLVSVSRD